MEWLLSYFNIVAILHQMAGLERMSDYRVSSACLSVCLFVCLSVCLSVFICLPTCLPLCLFYLSVCLCVCFVSVPVGMCFSVSVLTLIFLYEDAHTPHNTSH